MDISIIVPVHNGSSWIKPCFESILQQNLGSLKVEVCVCNDASTDETSQILETWSKTFQDHSFSLKVFTNDTGQPGGVGYSKNKAFGISSGDYLCFQDIDDVMLPDRIMKQHQQAIKMSNNVIIGSKFKRFPENSTERYTKWANSLTPRQLQVQIYTSNGPTVIMPTWFCHRSVFERIGGFSEEGKGTPEDLIFFYKHLDLGGKIFRVEECLLVYTYHLNAATFSVLDSTIWNWRVDRLEDKVLKNWKSFTIWNAGKQGRKLYNSLRSYNQKKVRALCDVDLNKIGKKYVPYDPIERKEGVPLDIVHFKSAKPPFVICVKMGLSNGVFEENLKTLQLTENEDYILFS